MSAETNLQKLLQEMNPELNPGEYVFISLNVDKVISKKGVICEFKEKETNNGNRATIPNQMK